MGSCREDTDSPIECCMFRPRTLLLSSASIYRSSDVYLNPTLKDNYPTTTWEAMACGTPVVTFDTGGALRP